MLTMNEPTNPCCEIKADMPPQPVVPWVQVAMMNMLRVRNGGKPMTLEECEKLRKDLESQHPDYIEPDIIVESK